jgi:tetratricopeptide (TPR) repeat protein
VYDSRADSTTVLFLSSGHVRPYAAADVDGDGRKEILFRGFANRMGMNGALAALRVPAVRVPAGGQTLTTPVVATPDLQPALTGQDLLAWYSLAPAAAAYSSEVLPPETERRVVPLPLWGGGRTDWSFDGFAFRARSPLVPGERNGVRERAYAALREAQRFRARGSFAEALSEVETAASFAAASDDGLLSEWITRVRGALLASAGRFEEAEEVFGGVLATTGMTANVAWEAGRAFHVAGDLTRSVAWYRRGFSGTAARLQIGRHPRDLVEGAVLALGELGRWGDALAECDRLEAGYPDLSSAASSLRTYALWRSGRPAEPPAASSDQLDEYLVWGLESRFARGANPGTLLPEVKDLRRATVGVVPLLDSLEAELLAALGRTEEARKISLAALEGCRRGAGSDPVLRAHFDLVAGRARRLGVRPAAAGGRR